MVKRITTLMMLLLAMATAAFPANDNQLASKGNVPTLVGIVLNDPSAYYVASFPAAADAGVTKVFAHSNLDASGQAIYVDGLLYVQSICSNVQTGLSSVTQSVFDTDTWQLVDARKGLYQYSAAVSMAYDKTTGTVYGYFFDDASNGRQRFSFGTMNILTGETQSKFLLYEENLVMAMAASSDGHLYGVNANGMFVEIDKESGAQTNIGHTNIHPEHMQSAAIDHNTGRFYWASIDDMGTSALYEIDIETGQPTLITSFPNGEEFVGLYVMPDDIPADAPSPATDLMFDFTDDNLNGYIHFTLPETTAGGTELNGILQAHATIDGEGYSYESTPGKKCVIPVALSSEGMKLLTVTVSNEAGDSETAKAQRWIGPDYPAAVRNLTLAAEGNMAVLTWEAPTEGRNGGYINPNELTYEITQQGGGFFKDGHTETKLAIDFTGEVIADLSYSVRAVYKEHKSEVAYSNSISFSQPAYDVPLTFDFGDVFGLCTVIDVNEDGNTWDMTFNGLAIETPRGGSLDDWLILPPFNLEKDKMYEVSVIAEAEMGPLNPEVFEMRMGQSATTDGLSTVLSTQTIRTRRESEERCDTFSVDANGEYYFAIRAISESGKELSLDEFAISLLTDKNAPKGVEGLNAIAGENGLLEAAIEFKLPETTESGEEITGSLSAEISRGGTVIATIENLSAGSTCKYVDKDAQQGINTYSVTVLDESGRRSMTLDCSVRCGVDIPELPMNVRLVEEGNSVKLTWEHPTKGTNGGYVDAEGLSYTIYDPTYLMIIAEGIRGTEYVRDYDGLSGQSMLAFAIGVENLAGANPNVTVSNSVVLGNPLELPFEENFAVSNLPWFTFGSCWIDDNGWGGTQSAGADGKPGYSCFVGSGSDGEEESLVSPKLSLQGTGNPVLHFYCQSATQGKDVLNVEIATDFNGSYEVLKQINFAELTPSEWHEVTIPLNGYVEAEYIHVSFHAVPDKASSYSGICIDEITIRDLVPHDLEALSLTLDKEELNVGDKATATVAFRNIGSEKTAPEAFSVRLFADDRCVDTVNGIAVDPYASGSVQLEFVPQVSDSDIAQMRAEIVFADDVDVTNNTVAGDDVWIHKPERPAIADLAGYTDSNGQTVHLSWSCPDMSGDPVMERTDDFESYRPFSHHAGLWTICDVDGQIINTPYYFPGWNEAAGFMVLNPALTEVSENITLSDIWPAYSGEQFMAAFSPSPGDNDDWLITPELSGNAQTISFYARGGRESLGSERMEIYVSSAGNDIASMELLTPEAVMVNAGMWQRYSYDVPEGTLYLGIRCTSHARESLQIDNVTYESAARPLDVAFIGYNVYCDGRLMNDKPLSETFYTGKLADGELYTVRVVYDLGESEDSNAVEVSSTGIGQLPNGKVVTAVEYYDLCGRRISDAPANTFVIARYIYNDGTFASEKRFLEKGLE